MTRITIRVIMVPNIKELNYLALSFSTRMITKSEPATTDIEVADRLRTDCKTTWFGQFDVTQVS